MWQTIGKKVLSALGNKAAKKAVDEGIGGAVKVYAFAGAGCLIGLLACVIGIVMIIVAPVALAQEFVREEVQGLADWFSRLGHLLTFQGWCKDETECKAVAEADFENKLQELKDSYAEIGIDLDTPLMKATVTYSNAGFGTDYSSVTTDPNANVEPDPDDTRTASEKIREGTSQLAELARQMVVNDVLDLNNYRNYLINTYIESNYSSFLVSYTGDARVYVINKIANEIMSFSLKWDGGGTSGGTGHTGDVDYSGGTGGNNSNFVYFNQLDYNAENSFNSTSTIARLGSGVTALAMAISTLTGTKHDPVEIQKVTCENYDCKEGTPFAAILNIPTRYNLKTSDVGTGTDDLQKVIDALKTGNSVVIVYMGPGNFTKSTHYIVLAGVNENGEVRVYDPNDGEGSGTNKNWPFDTIVEELAQPNPRLYIISK